MNKSGLSRGLLLLAIVLALALSGGFAGAQKEVKQQPGIAVPETLLDGLKWRNIGPANMGGRIDDFA
ncbi:MAG: hypothetical protein FJY81_06105, partial [Candidatus Aminicenantes bacterium]|nr:hypothetical protein [Candidatus Aminicenantes bacterium]